MKLQGHFPFSQKGRTFLWKVLENVVVFRHFNSNCQRCVSENQTELWKFQVRNSQNSQIGIHTCNEVALFMQTGIFGRIDGAFLI